MSTHTDPTTHLDMAMAADAAAMAADASAMAADHSARLIANAAACPGGRCVADAVDALTAYGWQPVSIIRARGDYAVTYRRPAATGWDRAVVGWDRVLIFAPMGGHVTVRVMEYGRPADEVLILTVDPDGEPLGAALGRNGEALGRLCAALGRIHHRHPIALPEGH